VTQRPDGGAGRMGDFRYHGPRRGYHPPALAVDWSLIRRAKAETYSTTLALHRSLISGPRRQTLSPPWPRILINCKGQVGQLLPPWPRTVIVSAVRPPPTPGQGGVILYRLGHAFSKDDKGVGEDALGDGYLVDSLSSASRMRHRGGGCLPKDASTTAFHCAFRLHCLWAVQTFWYK